MESPTELAAAILILFAIAAGLTVASRMGKWAERKGAATTDRLLAGELETPLPADPPPPKLGFIKETLSNVVGVIAAVCVFVYVPWLGETLSTIDDARTGLILLVGMSSLVFLLVRKLFRKIVGRSAAPRTPPQSG